MSAVAEFFQVFCCSYQQIAWAELPAIPARGPGLAEDAAVKQDSPGADRAAATRARFVRAVRYRP